MSTRRFYSPGPVENRTIRIEGDEFYHLKTVDRLGIGDTVEVVDGRGSLYRGEIHTMKHSRADVRVVDEHHEPRSPLSVIVAPSLVKQRSMLIMVEKLTEIGVDEIRPVLFGRTDEKYSPSRLKKWQRLAVQSIKVNKRLWLTDIFEPVPLGEMVLFAGSHVAPDNGTRLILDINGAPDSGVPHVAPVLTLVGPPGGIREDEHRNLTDAGFIPFKLNNCNLKTETAAISISALLKARG